jgi:hypothetical protein
MSRFIELDDEWVNVDAIRTVRFEGRQVHIWFGSSPASDSASGVFGNIFASGSKDLSEQALQKLKAFLEKNRAE